MPAFCLQFYISPLNSCFLMQNSYMFLKKTLKNTVGQIILLPGQLYLVKDLVNRKQNKEKRGWGVTGQWRNYFLAQVQDEVEMKRMWGNWEKKEGTEQIASKNGAKNIQSVLGISKSSCFDSGSWNLLLNIFVLNLHNSIITALKTSALFCKSLWPFLEDAESLLVDNAGYKRNPFPFF